VTPAVTEYGAHWLAHDKITKALLLTLQVAVIRCEILRVAKGMSGGVGRHSGNRESCMPPGPPGRPCPRKIMRPASLAPTPSGVKEWRERALLILVVVTGAFGHPVGSYGTSSGLLLA
jgi:hypothetical protein